MEGLYVEGLFVEGLYDVCGLWRGCMSRGWMWGGCMWIVEGLYV